GGGFCLRRPALRSAGALASQSAAPPGAQPQSTKPRLRPAAPEPLPSATLEATIGRGFEYLLQNQNADGSWGSPRWTGGVDRDPVPGAFHSFGVACTALCLEALLEAGDAPKVRQAAERAEAYLWKNLAKLRRAGGSNLPHVRGHR